MMKNLRFITFATVISLSSCVGMKDVDMGQYALPEQYVLEVKDNNSLIFTVTASVSSDHFVDCGFYYGKSRDMHDAESVRSKFDYGMMSQDILLRDYGSDYYIYSFVSDGDNEVVSTDAKVVTVGSLYDYVDFPGSIALDAYYSSSKTAVLTVNYDLAEGVSLTSCGVCYGRVSSISKEDSHVESDKIRSDCFTVTLPQMDPGVRYYLRPYIMDGEHIAYDEVTSMTFYAIPEVKTIGVESVQEYSAYAYGEVMDDCGKYIEERGFVIAEGNTNPTTSSIRHIVYGQEGEFDLEITGLDPNTLYSIRAYARNSEGTAYGETMHFTTDVAMPSVVTDYVSSITSSSAKVYAKVTDDGGETVSDFGLLLSTSPEIDPTKAEKVSASGYPSSYNVTISNLVRKTKYYVQAYVTNSAGTAYGKVVGFETLAELPTVSTLAVTEITDVSAKSGGNVTDDGGDEITARGVVWGKNHNPTLSKDFKTEEDTGIGQFRSDVIGLEFSTVYYLRAYATNSAGTAYGDEIKFETEELDLANIKNLAEYETANCYIISEAGTYRFPAVKGNSDMSVGSVASVHVLWESFGTNVKPKEKDLIASLMYYDGQILFKTVTEFKEGNAVIAVKDAYGTILWSWHIWLTDKPIEQTYANNAGIMMDRNLGAISATPGDVGALGLLYQWGRKDPFLGSSSISSDIVAQSTGIWPSAEWSSSTTGTLGYVTRNPMTFIKFNAANYDWYYTGDSSTDDTRWKSVKTIYDPCPSGWRVPDGGDKGVWTNAGFTDTDYDDINKGILWDSVYSIPSAWYPAAGHASVNVGTVFNVGNGHYWSVTVSDNDAYSLDLLDDGSVSQSDVWRAAGKSVRCLQE